MRGILLGITVFALTASAAKAGPLYDECGSVSTSADNACRGVEVVSAAVASTCRWATGVDEACVDPITGRAVTRAAVDAYQDSWVHRSLSFQHDLANDVPLLNGWLVSTHNSFNYAARTPSLSQMDANQQHSLVDQLRMDVRSLELDLHWFPSLSAGGARTVVVCHARGPEEQHAGCSTENELRDRLAEIRPWLLAHPDQVLLLYLEDDLDRQAAPHNEAAAQISEVIGDLVYRPAPSGDGCAALPFSSLSRSDVLADGKQVVIVSGCGVGADWRGLVWDWSDREEERPRGFADFPACGPEVTREEYGTRFVRYYEDSTGLTAGLDGTGHASADDGIDPATARFMTRCGVDMIGFDQLLPDDGRLEALVWSWAPGEPSAAGDCALMGADGRWRAAACGRKSPRRGCGGGRRPKPECGRPAPLACRAADGSWSVAAKCPEGSAFAAPRTGFENEQLRAAAAGSEVRLGLARSDDSWVALDAR